MQLCGLPNSKVWIVRTCSATGIWLLTFITAGQVPEHDRVEHGTAEKKWKALKVFKTQGKWKLKSMYLFFAPKALLDAQCFRSYQRPWSWFRNKQNLEHRFQPVVRISDFITKVERGNEEGKLMKETAAAGGQPWGAAVPEPVWISSKCFRQSCVKDKIIKYLCLGSVRSTALGEIQARVPFSHIYLSLGSSACGQLSILGSFLYTSPPHMVWFPDNLLPKSSLRIFCVTLVK